MSKIELNPQCVFDCFGQVNQVPRPSKHEEAMISFLLSFGKGLGLDTQRDETGNVIICKPATPGYEDRKTVVLQSHIDMVCEKNNDVEFDFTKDAIQTYVDGEWLKARGTTLGADDGIGVAMEMAILKSDDIEHGPIECVFTVDEETGLTGAEGMKPDFMSGRMLVNLDSEDEGQIFVSCAGGCRTAIQMPFQLEPMPQGFYSFSLCIKGLTGGHSGDDIEKKRANANKLLARFLYLSMKKYDLRLADIQAGGLHNAIPREASCVCSVPLKDKENICVDWNLFASDVEQEYNVTEQSMEFHIGTSEPFATVMDKDTSTRLITALQAVDNGVYAMCQNIDMVETSSNLASIRMNRDTMSVDINSSQRSSIHSARVNMANTIAAVFELAGARVQIGEGYPGWKMNPRSELLKVAVDEYRNLTGKEPLVRGIHAGLECGLFSEKFPGMDMISVGPTMRGVHSPEEKLYIPSVGIVWDWLLAILRNIPAK